MRNHRHIAISFFTALVAACVPGFSHSQATGPAFGTFKLYFTDDVVRKCAARYPKGATSLTGSFELMKRRNASYLSASDWERIRRENMETALRQRERDGYINEIISARSCALVLNQLSVGGELDQHIAKNFRKVHGRGDAP